MKGSRDLVKKGKDLSAALRLRACILSQLYALFQQVPLAPVELRQLAEFCNVPAQALNWNIIYLEKKGWVRLSHDSNCPPYASCYVELTGTGIDLVEDAETFDRVFLKSA